MRSLVCTYVAAAALLTAPLGCAHVGPIALDCAAEVALDVLDDVSRAMDASADALDAKAVRYGLATVACVVRHLLALELPAAAGARAVSGRELHGRTFLARHP